MDGSIDSGVQRVDVQPGVITARSRPLSDGIHTTHSEEPSLSPKRTAEPMKPSIPSRPLCSARGNSVLARI